MHTKRSIGPFLTKRLRETKTYISIEELPDAGKKPEKAQSFRGRMAMGKVYFPLDATCRFLTKERHTSRMPAYSVPFPSP